MSNINRTRNLITSFIGMVFLLTIFLVSISFTHQVVFAQNLDKIVSDEMDKELRLYEESRTIPVYQANEELVNDTPLETIVHGQCGTHPNTCIQGVAVNINKDKGYRWSCEGKHGGSASPCYIKESDAERKQRRQIELTKKIDQEISDHVEGERLKVLEDHGQETIDRLEDKNTDKTDSYKDNRVSAVQHNASLNTVHQTYPAAKRFEDEVRVYISGGAGVSVFSGVDNISNGLNAGVNIGAKFPANFLFEVGFSYSDFKLDNYYGYSYSPARYLTRAATQNSQCIDCRIKEYAGILNVKYHLFNLSLRPFAGISGIYRYRTYEDDYYKSYSRYNSSSHGLDMGPNVGVDFALSSQFMVGVEFKYMINLTNSVSDSHMIYNYRLPEEQLSDDLSYFTFGINAKFLL